MLQFCNIPSPNPQCSDRIVGVLRNSSLESVSRFVSTAFTAESKSSAKGGRRPSRPDLWTNTVFDVFSHSPRLLILFVVPTSGVIRAQYPTAMLAEARTTSLPPTVIFTGRNFDERRGKEHDSTTHPPAAASSRDSDGKGIYDSRSVPHDD